MPLAHVRVCQHCDSIRWAPCSLTCRTPLDTDPQSWRINLQDGAGELLPEEQA